MTIKMLKDCPEFAKTVTAWLNKEFGTPASQNFYKELVEHSLSENQLPLTFVAVENDVLLGTVGLWRADLLSRQDLGPWLSGLVVAPDKRNEGIGQVLQQFLLQYCKNKTWDTLYLYTDLEGYYEKTGWLQIGTGYEYMGDKVRIYQHAL